MGTTRSDYGQSTPMVTGACDAEVQPGVKADRVFKAPCAVVGPLANRCASVSVSVIVLNRGRGRGGGGSVQRMSRWVWVPNEWCSSQLASRAAASGWQ